VPLSRSRKKKKHSSPASSRPAEVVGPKGSRRWVVPAMVTFLLVGLAWIVVYYLTQGDIPGMRALGDWNLLIGMGLILLGLLTAMRWE
jgi:Cell division protein CrgA